MPGRIIPSKRPLQRIPVSKRRAVASTFIEAPAAVPAFPGEIDVLTNTATNIPSIAEPYSPHSGSVGGIYPESSNALGPYADTNGNLYTITEYTPGGGDTTTPYPAMRKSTDGGNTWAEVDAANRPTTAQDLESAWLVQFGTKLLLLRQRSGTSSPNIAYTEFNTSDAPSNPDKWSGTVDDVAGTPTALADSAQAVALAVRQNGDMYAFYVVYNGTNYMVKYKKKPSGGAWGAENQIGTTSKNNHQPVIANTIYANGDSIPIMVFNKVDLTLDLYYLSSSDVLTGPTVVATGLSSSGNLLCPMITPAVRYTAPGSVDRYMFAWQTADGGSISAVPIDNGTVGSIETNVTDNSVWTNPTYTTSLQPAAGLAVDTVAAEVFIVYSDNTNHDLWVARRNGSWGTDTQIVASTECQFAQANVFLHSPGNGGVKVLGIVWDFDPTPTNEVDEDPRYNEINLSVGNQVVDTLTNVGTSSQSLSLDATSQTGSSSGSGSQNLGLDATSEVVPGVQVARRNATIGASVNLTSSTIPWINPGNVFSSDDSYATATDDGSFITRFLCASGFNFGLQNGARTSGIVFKVERKASASSQIQDESVLIFRHGTGDGSDHVLGDTPFLWTTSDVIVTYGTWNDKWGLPDSYLTPVEVNDSGFGIAFSVDLGGIVGTVGSVDQIRGELWHYVPMGESVQSLLEVIAVVDSLTSSATSTQSLSVDATSQAASSSGSSTQALSAEATSESESNSGSGSQSFLLDATAETTSNSAASTQSILEFIGIFDLLTSTSTSTQSLSFDATSQATDSSGSSSQAMSVEATAETDSNTESSSQSILEQIGIYDIVTSTGTAVQVLFLDATSESGSSSGSSSQSLTAEATSETDSSSSTSTQSISLDATSESSRNTETSSQSISFDAATDSLSSSGNGSQAMSVEATAEGEFQSETSTQSIFEDIITSVQQETFFNVATSLQSLSLEATSESNTGSTSGSQSLGLDATFQNIDNSSSNTQKLGVDASADTSSSSGNSTQAMNVEATAEADTSSAQGSQSFGLDATSETDRNTGTGSQSLVSADADSLVSIGTALTRLNLDATAEGGTSSASSSQSIPNQNDLLLTIGLALATILEVIVAPVIAAPTRVDAYVDAESQTVFAAQDVRHSTDVDSDGKPISNVRDERRSSEVVSSTQGGEVVG